MTNKRIIILVFLFMLLFSACGNNASLMESGSGWDDLDTPSAVTEVPVQKTPKVIHKKKQDPVPVTETPELNSQYVIVLDPGHAAHLNEEYEPVGPGAQETKRATVIGTVGVTTRIYEYELNMDICKMLRTELQNRGYQVIMTKEEHDEVLSNIQRAQIANDADADVFLRIHADASDDTSDSGAMAMCITSTNPFTPETYLPSRLLAESILSEYCALTGFSNCGIEETDSMTGNNWSKVPCVLLEMGYLTNPEDDRKMATEEMRKAMVCGIADGLDNYFEKINRLD